ncbi:MAG: hypothetical protein Q9220_004569 [cf. Caloplaca sp. 1 TL-2023]
MTGSFVKTFWRTYAETLSLILSATNCDDLPKLSYLLEEDLEIRGFRPLQEAQEQREASVSQPDLDDLQSHGPGNQQDDESTRTLFRTYLLLEDAFKLVQNEYVPVYLMQDTKSFSLLEACKDTIAGTHSPLESNSALAHSGETFPAESNLQMGNGPTNETSYAVGDSTLTALKSIEEAQSRALLHRHSERVNAGTAQPDDNFVSTRPETSDQSTDQSQHDIASPSQQQMSTCAIQSTLSSMPDPTQLSPVATRQQQQHPLQRKRKFLAAAMEGFSFDSSNIIVGSSMPFDNQNRPTSPTPPNGQG